MSCSSQQALDEHQVECKLHMVNGGAQAIDFISHMGRPENLPCPDLMLLDLNLPKIAGPQVLTHLRKHPKCARTPVIVVTSSNAQSDRARMAELGISRYFRKPSDFDAFMQLGAVVREVIALQDA